MEHGSIPATESFFKADVLTHVVLCTQCVETASMKHLSVYDVWCSGLLASWAPMLGLSCSRTICSNKTLFVKSGSSGDLVQSSSLVQKAKQILILRITNGRERTEDICVVMVRI